MASISGCAVDEEELFSDPLSKLPVELTSHIFSFLDPEILFVVASVSKNWRRLVNNDVIWRSICRREDLHDENFPHEFGLRSALQPEGWCRWAQVYRTAIYRRRKWANEDTIDLCPSNNSKCFGAHGTTIAVADCRGTLTILSNVGNYVVPVQEISISGSIRDVHVSLNTVVALVGEWAVVFHLVNGKFETEAVFHPELEHRHDLLSDLTDDCSENEYGPVKGPRTLFCTHEFVWFKLSNSNIKIYGRSSKGFVSLKVKNVTDVKCNMNWAVVLSPGAIDVFRHNGGFVFSVADESFYTGLVLSSSGAAFLESPDFGDPVAAYVDLTSRRKTVLAATGGGSTSKLKVYKLTLFKDTVFCLNGREKFDLSCHRAVSGRLEWIVPLAGSKYLRPGKDFFQIVCSKFIFLSPAQVRLDVFNLYDKDTGAKLYTVSIHISSYNISQVSDAGIIMSNSGRSRTISEGNHISWISLA